MLAEIRSYGVSLVIADQSQKVTTDVVALTDMKVVLDWLKLRQTICR